MPVTFFVHRYSGLKEYMGANPALKTEHATMIVQSKFSDVSSTNGDYEDEEVQDQFYDAIAEDSSSSEDEDSDDSGELDKKVFFLILIEDRVLSEKSGKLEKLKLLQNRVIYMNPYC